MKNLRILLVGLALCAGTAADSSEAQAACGAARTLGSLHGSGSTTLSTPGGPFPYTGTNVSYYITGAFWSLGAGDPRVGHGNDSGANTGRATVDGPARSWLSIYAGGSEAFIGGSYSHWQNTGTDGCIDMDGSEVALPDADQCLVVLLTDDPGLPESGGHFAALSVRADLNGNYPFTPAFGFPQVVELAPIPAPALVGTDQTKVMVPEPTAGLHLRCGDDVVVGYRLYARCSPPEDGPIGSERASGWINVVAATTPLGESVSIPGIPVDPCADGDNAFLAASLVFDSGFETDRVSTPLGVALQAVDPGDDGGNCDCNCPGHGDPPRVESVESKQPMPRGRRSRGRGNGP